MPISTTSVIEDAPQADGMRWVRYEFTWSEGVVRQHGPKLVPASFDTAADMSALRPYMESQYKQEEYELALRLFFEGKHIGNEIAAGRFKVLTSDQVHRKCLRRAANLMEAADPAAVDWGALARASVWVQTLGNANIRTWFNYAGGPVWAVNEAGTWKGDLASIQIAVAQAPHGKGELDEEAA